MPNDLVRWNDLHTYFADLYPATVRYVIANQVTRAVSYLGNKFELRPRPGGTQFDVYGPAAIHAQGAA